MPIAMAPLAGIRNLRAGSAATSDEILFERQRDGPIEQHGKSGLHARDSAPGLSEIAGFHFGRRGRMIRCDDVDGSREQLCPQSSLLGRGAQRRRALRDSTQAFDVFLGEEQIVRAGFDGNVRALRASLSSEGHTASGADVNDMQFRTGLAGQQRSALDGFQLGDHWARREECATLPSFCDSPGKPCVSLLAFRVHRDGQAEPRRFAQSFKQSEIVGARKFRQIRNRTETL